LPLRPGTREASHEPDDQYRRLRQLIVIDEGKLVGIVSIGDVVKYRLEDLETESSVLRDAYIAAH
jgi:CBS domain-containing protein